MKVAPNFNRMNTSVSSRRLICAAIVAQAIIFSCASPDRYDLAVEKEKIKAVIASETESYYKQDFAAWRKNFLDDPAFRQYSYWEGWPEKVQFYNGFKALEEVKRSQFQENRTIWKGSRDTRENENFRISSDMAWYTFEQSSWESGTDKFLGKSLETRILEKVDGEWKIAYLGYHYFPTDTAGTAGN